LFYESMNNLYTFHVGPNLLFKNKTHWHHEAPALPMMLLT
jgi:hypothetical protein